MGKVKAFYQQATDTIRQYPDNYCLAVKRGKRWYLDFDLACDLKLAKKVLHASLSYLVTYGTGENFIKAINRIK